MSYSKLDSDVRYLRNTEAAKFLLKTDASTMFADKTEFAKLPTTYVTKTDADNKYMLKTNADDFATKTYVNTNFLKLSDTSGFLKASDANNFLAASTADNKYAKITDLTGYLSKTEADIKYALKGTTTTSSSGGDYLSKTDADTKYAKFGDLSNFLAKTDADTKYAKVGDLTNYLAKTDADTKFISKLDADTKYAKVDSITGFLNKAEADTVYAKISSTLSRTDADKLYMPITATAPLQTSSSSTTDTKNYLTASAADVKYLTPSSADAKYLTSSTADAKFLTSTTADAKYLTNTVADAKYLSASTADAKYLTTPIADAKYLAASAADAKYLSKSAADALIKTSNFVTKTENDDKFAKFIPKNESILLDKNKFVEFGTGETKEVNAGKIKYKGWSDGLDIVGATVDGANARKVKIWDTLDVSEVTTSGVKLPRGRNIEFGVGEKKEVNAGKIVYKGWTDGLDIVGATVDGTPLRKVKVFDMLEVDKIDTGNVRLPKGKAVEFGVGENKEANAGKIVYKGWTDGLDIVGATVDGTPLRKVKVFDMLEVDKIDFNHARLGKGKVLDLGYGEPNKQVDAGKITYKGWSNGLDIVGATVEGSNARQVTLWDMLLVSEINTGTINAGNINTSNTAQFTSPGWFGPYVLETYNRKLDGVSQCLDSGQFVENNGGTFKCIPGNTWQQFYHNPMTGQLRNVQTGTCLEKTDGAWKFATCSASENQQFSKNAHSLQWRDGNCYDASNQTTRNSVCNKASAGQQFKWVYAK